MYYIQIQKDTVKDHLFHKIKLFKENVEKAKVEARK